MTRRVSGQARSADSGLAADPWFTPELVAFKAQMIEAIERPKAS